MMNSNGFDAKGQTWCVWCDQNTTNEDGICEDCQSDIDQWNREARIVAECAQVAEEFTSDTSPLMREFMDVSADDASDPGPEWQLAGIALTEAGPRSVFVRRPAVARAR
jgi:predicted amidophosphoribosyltransferase